MSSKTIIGYALVAVAAFLIGTQAKMPLRKYAEKFRPADVATYNS
jgi:hypothetical protein